MLLKEVIKEYYNKLLKEKEENYDVNSTRYYSSSKASKLIEILDEKDMNGENIDEKIISFFNFINGYDTPRFDVDKYLYSIDDLEREYKELGNLDNLIGSNVDIDIDW